MIFAIISSLTLAILDYYGYIDLEWTIIMLPVLAYLAYLVVMFILTTLFINHRNRRLRRWFYRVPRDFR